MKIDGKVIAQQILDDLKQRVDALKNKGITPRLVIILVGNSPASETYVKQKVLKGESIGVKVTVENLPTTLTQYKLLQLSNDLNHLTSVHGIIVQRPLPDHIDEETIDKAVIPQKDVDGFHPDSRFDMPLAAAVLRILEEVYKFETRSTKLEMVRQAHHKQVYPERSRRVSGFDIRYSDLISWIKTKKIVVMGKGKTGGGPVLSTLAKLGVQPLIVDSKTPDPRALTKNADIIICAVGQPHMLTKDMIKKGVALIAVGMHKGEDSKMHGDYEEEEIKDVAEYYTPVPGGVGPVNVAMLLENVVKAAESIQ